MSSAMDQASKAWLRAKRFIPNGCQTLSKGSDRYVDGVYPKLLVGGHGCEVSAENDTCYIDYISALGAILLGYSNPAVDDAVKESINSGQVLLSLPHPREGELAEKLAALTGHDKVKFFKTGSESTSAAVRLARAYTGRDIILMCGYNGWHDWACTTYDRTAGIPYYVDFGTKKFTYNDWASYEQFFNQSIAAIILEPVQYDSPKDDFLRKAVDLARHKGAMVIFDEIVNGLRFGAGGSGSLFGIKPDLTCLGKALGNGYAVSALAGDDRFMGVFEQDDFLASGTFSGELIGISAGLAVLEQLESGKIWEAGTILKTGFNGICNDLGIGQDVQCIGYAPRTKFRFTTEEHKALFWQECIKRSILFGYANFPTQSHGKAALSKTLSVCEDALRIVKKNWESPELKMEGALPKAAMR